MKLVEKSVLVTGAGGFIGSHLTERLVEQGCNVKCFVRYNSRNDWGLLEILPKRTRDRLEIVASDLKDPDAVRYAVKDVEIIFHLGALIAIPYSYNFPRDSVETNVIGTLNLLNAARASRVEKIVHTSTSEVYGTAKYVPIDEKHPLQGQSPYSASKIGADKIAESFYRSYDLPVTIIRPFNTYGPRQSARAVIPTIISQALTSDVIKLGSLHPTRDYTYVSDVVDAFVKVAESKSSIGEEINIGSGIEISIGDLANRIISIIGKKVEVETDNRRIRPDNSEVERLLCNGSKAKKMLGWEPRVKLDEGLQQTIAWIKENIDSYKPEVYNI